MLVYGDRRRQLTWSQAIAAATEALPPARGAPGPAEARDWIDELDAARAALVALGQIEQAVHDHVERGADDPVGARALAAAELATEASAAAFLAAWAHTQSADPAGVLGRLARADIARAAELAAVGLRDVTARLGGGRHEAEPCLSLTVPEGFSAYALFADQYAVAARSWASSLGRADAASPVLVVGVRSIGTTLSAVVAGVVRAAGHDVERTTVRPTGHPYRREVELRLPPLARCSLGTGWALVVDEGPGRSGSSMAAVVEALRAAGVPSERIVLLPGHAGEPGPEAGERERAIWATTAREVAAPGSVGWRGDDLAGVLAQRTRAALGAGRGRPVGPVVVEELGGGAWRPRTFGDVAAWPAVPAAFARPALRGLAADDGGAVLWRFAGVDAPAVAAAWCEAERSAWRPRCVGTCWGFVGTQWVHGTALGPGDLDDDVLDVLASYLVASAGAPMPPDELVASVDRLATAVVHDVGEALGDAAAVTASEAVERARAFARSAATRSPVPVRRATDGRTDPHGWIRVADGGLVKVDGFGPEHDHTLVGAQPLAWDVAGTIVSWELDPRQRRHLLDRLAAGNPDLVVRPWERFHELARATLDLARFVMSEPAHAAGDDVRHAAALARARRRLEAVVQAIEGDDADLAQPIRGTGTGS